jgi:uncharacterized sulfatase
VHFRTTLPNVVTLPQMFINNGYYVARVGKIFHYGNPDDIGTNGMDDKVSWQERFNPAGMDKTSLETDVMNYTPNAKLGWAMAWYADPIGTDDQHTDGKVAARAIELMEKHKDGDKPFFIAAGFYKPHCPWITPKQYFDEYNISQIDLPPISDDTPSQYPKHALDSTHPWPYYGVKPDEAKQCKLAYYAAISFVDAQIGKLIDAVDRLGLADNTIIVFWSDHGYHLGEHGLFFKQSVFEEACRVPLVISVPHMKDAGMTSEKMVELVDLYPTLADLTGLTPPKDLQGFSMKSLVDDPDASSWDRPAFTQVQRGPISGRTVRTAKWRYTEWDFGKQGKELYDQDADPHEMKNLAEDASHADDVAKLSGMLKKMFPVDVRPAKAEPQSRQKYAND